MTDNVTLARGIVQLNIKHDPQIEGLITDFRQSISSDLYQSDVKELTDRQLATVDLDAFGRLAIGSVGFYQAALTLAKRNYVSGRWRLAREVRYWSDWVDLALPDSARVGPKTAAMLRRIKTILNHYIPAVCDPLMKQPLLVDGKLIALSVEGRVANLVPTGKFDAAGKPITTTVASEPVSEVIGLTKAELMDLRREGIQIVDPLDLKPSLFEELGPVVQYLDTNADEAHRELFEKLITVGATKNQKELRAQLRALPVAPPPPITETEALDECEVVIYNEVDEHGKTLRTITEYRVKCTSDYNAAKLDLQLHGNFRILPPRTEPARLVH